MATKIRGITIELGADASGLNKALKEVNSKIGQTQKELRDVNKLLKMDPGNADLLAQKHRMLGDRVEETKDKLEALRNAQDEITKAFDNGEIDQGQYDAFQREIISCENELKNLQKEFYESNVAAQKLAETGEKIKNFGAGLENAGNKLMPVTAAITGLGVATGKMATDFEDSMAKVSTIADETEVPIDEMKDAILDLSNETGIASGDIAENVYNAISAGQKTGDAVEFVGKAAKLAKAGFAETGDALDVLTTILNAYGLEASEVTNVSDRLIQVQNLGKTTVGELSSVMGKIIPTANALGVNLSQLGAGYAVMTANGIATAETTTYMNSMFNELGKSGTTAQKALAEYTKETYGSAMSMKELMDEGFYVEEVLQMLKKSADESGKSIADMFGSAEAGKAATVILDHSDEFYKAFDAMGSSAGATEEAFLKLDTTSNQMNISMNKVKNSGIELGESVMETVAPMLETLAEKIDAATTWFNSLDDSQKQTIVQVGMLIAAIGPVLIILGNLASAIGSIMGLAPKLAGGIGIMQSAFSKLWAVILANPIVAIIAAIVALVALIATKGDEIQAIIQKVDDFLQGVFAKDWTEVFGPVLGGAINNFMAMMKSQWDAIKKIFDGIIDFIRGVFTGDWERAWNGVKEIFGGVFDGLIALAKAPINKVISMINGLFSGINSVASKVGSSIQIPTIPMLASGGTVLSGSAIVGEAGAELLNVNNGVATVTPLTNSGSSSHTDITDLLKEYLPYLAEGTQLVLDSGALVGATAPQMNSALGKIAARASTR